MRTFRHTHSSSRYDRTPNTLEAALDRYMEHADLITLTEVASPARSDKVKEAGWRCVYGNHGGGDDSAIAWRNTEFEEVYSTTVPLTNGKLPGSRTDIHAAVAVLDHRTGPRLLVLSVHLPAGIEGNRGFKDVRRYVVWRISQNNLRVKANSLGRKFKVDGIMIVADWNINIKMDWVGRWFKVNYPRYKITWQKPFPSRGTHHRRIIDLTLIKGKLKVVKKPQILDKDSSSDHTPYSEVLGF